MTKSNLTSIYKAILAMTTAFVVCFGCDSREKGNVRFICPPCGQDCDTLIFRNSKQCPHCKMNLVQDLKDMNAVSSPDQIKMHGGSGGFVMNSLRDDHESYKVRYYKPSNYSDTSRVLMVIPGAGRNADSYRDAWIDAAEKHSLLILSPRFSERSYGFADYHLSGLLEVVNLSDAVSYSDTSNLVWLDETVLNIKENVETDSWLFDEFDHIFNLTVKALGNNSDRYDIFGHSAGGQILHRLALFHQSDKVNRIVAANSGFYTLPDSSMKMPFGIKKMQRSTDNLQSAFVKNLVVHAGELDNEDEQRGTLLRSKSADNQGKSRVERARYFFSYSEELAQSLGFVFNWRLEVVANVGHSHTDMTKSATEILYQ